MKYILIVAVLIALRLFVYPLVRRLVATMMLRAGTRGALEDVGAKALANVPDRILLVHQKLNTWNPGPEVVRLCDPLFSNGFQEGGLYSIREMPGMMVRFMIKPAECVVAAVYLSARGTWLELFTHYQNGDSATFSNRAAPGLDPRPSHPVVHAPGASSADLYHKLVNERPKGVFRPLMTEDIGPAFERAYAEAATWRKNKGVTAAEVVQVAQRRAG